MMKRVSFLPTVRPQALHPLAKAAALRGNQSQARRLVVPLLLASALAAGVTTVQALELPDRRPGLWKESMFEGKSAEKPDSVAYQCVDESSDRRLREMAKKMNACEEGPTVRRGNRITGSNVCRIAGSKVTTEYVITGNMKTEFRVQARSRHEPPLFGTAENETLTVSEWQGPCKPGQKPGDIVFSDDGAAGEVRSGNVGNVQDMARVLEQLQSDPAMSQIMEQVRKAGAQAAEAGVDMKDIGKMMEQMQQLQQQFKR